MEKCKVVLASSSAMKIIENRDSLSKTVEEQINQGILWFLFTYSANRTTISTTMAHRRIGIS